MQYWLQPLAICVLYRVLIRAVRCLQGVEEGPGREGGPAMAFLFILLAVAIMLSMVGGRYAHPIQIRRQGWGQWPWWP